MSDNRGHDPAEESSPAGISVPMKNESTPTSDAPNVVAPDTQVEGRGADTPIARPK